MGSVSGLERSPEGGNGNPLQYSCLGNPMDRGAWRACGHGGHKRLGHDLVTEHVCTLPAIVSGTYVSGIGPTPWQRPCHMTRRHRTMCSEEPSWNNWKERYSDMGAICQAAQTITAIQRCKAHSGVQPKFTYSNKLLLWSADGHRILG